MPASAAPLQPAGSTREAIVAVLEAAGRPLDLAAIADAVGRHPNSVREHLDGLVAGGRVARRRREPGGRGRPAFLYERLPEPEPAGVAAYRSLASVLAAELAGSPGAHAVSLAAGERWGAGLITEGRVAPLADIGQGVDRLVAILDDAGVAPDLPPTIADDRSLAPLVLRRCPFEPVARAQPGVVCGVHLGMIRGALETLGAPIDVTALEPFPTPDRCLVHLAATGRPGGAGAEATTDRTGRRRAE